jgi:hypothetical protein
MFEQASRLAEKLAAGVSRRGFLGSLGAWAAVAALGMAGVLTGIGTARANNKCPHTHCCIYTCANLGPLTGKCNQNPCPPTYLGCSLQFCAATAPPLCDCLSW